MFLHKIFVKNTLRTIEPKNHQKSLRSDFTGSYKKKRVERQKILIFLGHLFFDLRDFRENFKLYEYNKNKNTEAVYTLFL